MPLIFSSISLLLANLFALYGIFFLNITAENVFMIYWTESIIVFIYTLVKMLNAKYVHTKDPFPYIKMKLKSKNILFHTLLFSFLNYWVFYMFKQIYPNIDYFSVPLIVVVSFVLSHGVSYYFNFIKNEEFKKYNYIEIFNRGFLKRYVIMYFSIILAVLIFPLYIKTNSIYFLVVFVLFKTFADLYFHVKDHNNSD